MSILLDAITRNKQQQQTNIVDVVSTPRAHYPSQPKVSATTKKMTVLALAISLGIGGAWSVSLLLQPGPSSIQLATLPVINPNVNANVNPNVDPQGSPTDLVMPGNGNIVQPSRDQSGDAQARIDQVSADQNHIVQGNDQVRLAGKVALPIAQPYTPRVNQTAMGVNTDPNFLAPNALAPNSLAYNDTGSSNQAVDRTNVNQQQVSNRDIQTVSAQQMPDRRYERSNTDFASNQSHANRKSQAEIEALRLQINAAANEVDFASVSAPKVDQSNNLLAAFKTALKDVEYERSVNQPVTQEELDPIPRPSNQQIPKYGDLPASIQLQVPEFNINAHVYSSEPNNRWLNVDGVELQQGDMISNKLTIIEIRPRDIVLEISGEQFRVPAI
ncbi:general secretion pathway protein GspB [Shewanella sp. T24-MNA-CIBAN-0130]|uniref:general secretion pathway protein GspB n=1 Tax=Shewanella sp. T24-MNA-CIBAN-0130 TaxID=3140470 RepID=UPI003324CD4C